MILQTILMPGLEMNIPYASYFNSQPFAPILKLKDRTFFLQENNEITFNTIYNIFDLSFWTENTVIDNIYLYLVGEGKVRIRCFHAVAFQPDKVILEEDINLTRNGVSLNISQNISKLKGYIYVHLTALCSCNVERIAFCTNSPPCSKVKMGIVVTHFNRKEFVLPFIQRYKNYVFPDKAFNKNNVKLIVIDNSKNLPLIRDDSIIIIKNINLGGSGGFARGLLYLLDNSFSHCIFADDDGTYELENIYRIYVYYSLVKASNVNIAISATLISLETPSIIYTKGEISSPLVTSRRLHNLPITQMHELLEKDSFTPPPNYGAWCLFSFQLKKLNHFPFPFFIKGDDILFSLMNKFFVLTTFGIVSYIEDFTSKRNAFTKFLSFRADLIISMVTRPQPLRKVIKRFAKKYLKELFSYNYKSAYAILLSQKSVLKGKEFFVDDIDLKKTYKRISEFGNFEVLSQQFPQNCVYPKKCSISFCSKVTRLLTLQGILLPNVLLEKKPLYITRGSLPYLSCAFPFSKILYHSKKDNLGYIAYHNKSELLLGLVRFFIVFLYTILFYKFAIKSLQSFSEESTSSGFWKSCFRRQTPGS